MLYFSDRVQIPADNPNSVSFATSNACSNESTEMKLVLRQFIAPNGELAGFLSVNFDVAEHFVHPNGELSGGLLPVP